MRWNIRQEAKKLASNSPNPTQTSKLEPGQFQPLKEVSTRVFEIQPHSSVIGKNLLELFDLDHRRFAAVEALIRAGQAIELRPDLCLQAHDIVAVTASTENFLKPHALFEKEIAKPALLNLTEEVRDVILTNNHFSGKSIQQCYEDTTPEDHYGLFVSSVTRLGETLKADDHLILKRGDEIRLIGRPADLDRLSSRLGRTLPATKVTDFITFCFGIALGLLLGLIVVHLFGISVSLGTGGGCLLSGLIMGWLKSRHPRIGTLPHGASNFLRDFGLTVFVAVIGLNAGPQAITAIKQQGIELFLLGMGVTLIPQILSFFISFYLLKIKNPIELLATLAGGRSANPGFAALLEKAGNATPVVAFTVTYAIANILLTLWGPIIIALITKN